MHPSGIQRFSHISTHVPCSIRGTIVEAVSQPTCTLQANHCRSPPAPLPEHNLETEADFDWPTRVTRVTLTWYPVYDAHPVG